ncbi:ABC transporter family protein, partial [Vibrio parahaemolyticus V-223/04]
YFGSERSRLRD